MACEVRVRRTVSGVAHAVRATCIYARTGDIVAGHGSIQAPPTFTQKNEGLADHFGIGQNPSACGAVADRLGQAKGPDGMWHPFQRPQACRAARGVSRTVPVTVHRTVGGLIVKLTSTLPKQKEKKPKQKHAEAAFSACFVFDSC